jgi:hypothetical protein
MADQNIVGTMPCPREGYNPHGFSSTTVGLTAWTATVRLCAASGLGTA